MPGFNAISADKMARLLGTPNGPAIIDVRDCADRLIPGSLLREAGRVREWSSVFQCTGAVVVCDGGGDRSAGVAAFLRSAGIEAEVLEGGFAAWQAEGLATVDAAKLPKRDAAGRTVWVTRARPKVDRVACPWLIRRFVDPAALFLFVAPSEVAGVAERFGATPFDVEGAFWGHRGEQCTFDALVEDFGLGAIEALRRLAVIVRGADLGKPELAPQSAGLLAASLGLSRMYSSDMEQVGDGMILYDALYRWCRDAVAETHDQVSHVARSALIG